MDQYDSQPRRGHDGTPDHSTPTPIYDRLLAEWREAGRSAAEREAAVAPGSVRVFVPAARRT
ncbi:MULTISPECIES: hypothetical protein [Streptomyces]|uniref:Uncharacterized protein n=1 Tax=Streptomyces halstedii TaxID=1944 RepID=A0A6N9TZ92_STRHA|nr:MULTISPECIES: hypothetical protein [Streptomyces]AWL41435.1 hypothetical protein B9S64_27625 [Streptomyces sp. SM18]KDQ70400.1 hypothetical protein DT87_25345 [Streptomyces sp. NTK 937]MBV7671924.1 hypothetical protein [Streptomyces halstedii]MCW8219011.1 hypothetical protein [Streptomyces griseolus]MYQ53676.1 hypothetical protein [Streptomyces sp. SID4941]